MPTIYDIDYELQTSDLLPPDKRDPVTKKLVKALFSAVQWSRDLILGSYKTGVTAAAWSAGAYALYYQVKHNGKLWYNLVEANTDEPGTTATWSKLLDNLIGVEERVKYNGVSLVLEYALNRQFGGTFRQPVVGESDIYCTKLSPVETGWGIGDVDGDTAMGADISDEGIGGSYPFVRVNNFQINIPAALYALTTDEAIRNFVDIYIPASLNYTIVPY